VVVAAEVAQALSAPLDVINVRKISAPAFPELALGAVASGGVFLMNSALIDEMGLDAAQVRNLAEKEKKVLDHREKLYRAGRPFPDVSGASVIVVDDGIATGYTFLAALKALEAKAPARIIAAVPVSSPVSLRLIEKNAHQVVCLVAPVDFMGVGQGYESFDQVEDSEVVRLLSRAA
jgi:putative phosphoribosyl transferase